MKHQNFWTLIMIGKICMKFEKTSLEETKENLEWRKRAFEYKKRNAYGIENRNDMTNDMTRISNKKLKNKAECNLLHDIINTPKRAKKINSHYSPILHGCINTRKGKAKLHPIGQWI